MFFRQIGTGTGYNAALLAHRLGDERVFSVEVDAGLSKLARARLAVAGFRPTVVATDGAAGLPRHAPFDGSSPPAPSQRSPGREPNSSPTAA
ncbi:MAG TPA: hypothetical protein VFO16_21700 [Pseudonocardiaceae bacterium]|nr:hypothetical protein [Pseudonocardiaceae bacterium]